jgi:hypothetical protein
VKSTNVMDARALKFVIVFVIGILCGLLWLAVRAQAQEPQAEQQPPSSFAPCWPS